MKMNTLFIAGLSALALTLSASAKPEKEKGKGPKGGPKPFEKVDTDQDGKISEAEFLVGAKDADKSKARFAKMDKDADGFLNKEEYAKPKGKKGPQKPKKDKEPKGDA